MPLQDYNDCNCEKLRRPIKRLVTQAAGGRGTQMTWQSEKLLIRTTEVQNGTE